MKLLPSCPIVPRPVGRDSGTPWDTLGNQIPACTITVLINKAVILHTDMYRLFHGLSSSLSWPINNSVCLVSSVVPPVPYCPTVPFPPGWDSGTLGTVDSSTFLLRWIIRLTVDFPQFTCEAISLTDFPDRDNCNIWQSLWLDSLSPSFFRCSFSVE